MRLLVVVITKFSLLCHDFFVTSSNIEFGQRTTGVDPERNTTCTRTKHVVVMQQPLVQGRPEDQLAASNYCVNCNVTNDLSIVGSCVGVRREIFDSKGKLHKINCFDGVLIIALYINSIS